MNQPEVIECKDEFLACRATLWHHSAKLAIQIEKRLCAAFSDWSKAEIHSVARQITYDVVVGQITDRSSEQIRVIAPKYRPRSPELFRYPCITQWNADPPSAGPCNDDCDATWLRVTVLRSDALNTLSDLLNRHLPAIRGTMEREVTGSLKAGATASDVTSLAFQKIQQRLLDGRMELKTHPEFRSFCRTCARDVIRKLGRQVLSEDDRRFRRRQQIEQRPDENESLDDRDRASLPERAVSLAGKSGIDFDPLCDSRSPSEYMSVKDLKDWVDRMCSKLNPMDAYLLRKRTEDGLTFGELELDKVLNPDGKRTSEAIRKHFSRLLDRLREIHSSSEDENI